MNANANGAAKMTTTNTVKLSKGTNRVITTTVKGTHRATWANTAGEFAVISLEEAQARVAAMVADGWKVR